MKKKLLSIALSLMMLLLLAACGSGAEETLQVGFGRACITPEVGIALAGSSYGKYAEDVWDDLYATCIAFTDSDNNTALLFHMDLQRADVYAQFARKQLSDKYGIDQNYIIISSTHTHSGPDTSFYNRGGDTPDKRDVDAYVEETVYPAILDAAQQALDDRKPAQMYGASIELTNMNFNRHYLLSDGSYAGDIFGDFSGKTILGHAVEVDNEMQLLCFKREGGKDVVMANWQAHPHRSGNKHGHVTSDIVGPFRDYIEEQLDCQFAYFTGASGNVNSHSNISAENITGPYGEYVEHGQELGRYAIMALDNMKRLKMGKIQTATGYVDVGGVERQVWSFSLGSVGFAVAPYEMFSANGEFIKANSPFDMTFVVTCANGKYGYFATPEAIAYQCYEYNIDKNPLGAAEDMADKFVELLTTMHKDGGKMTTSEEEQKVQMVDSALYWNLDKGSERTANADGTYTVRFLKEDQVVTLQAANAEVLARIDAQNLMGFKLEGETITEVCGLMEMPYERLTWSYYVYTMSGSWLMLNSDETGYGKPVELTLDENVKVLDVRAGTQTPGQSVDLQINNRVTAVTDSDGNLLYLYVTA